MVFTIETPGIDGLCGVFTSKDKLLKFIKGYFADEFYAEFDAIEVAKEKLSQHDFDSWFISAYEDEDCEEYSHEFIIEAWPNNSHRFPSIRLQ